MNQTLQRRVVFVGSATELGGAEVALLSLLKELPRERYECEYASLEFGAGEMPQRVEALGVRVHRLPKGRLREAGKTAAKILALRRILRQGRADAVVANGGHPLVVARAAAALAGVPCAWWVHGYEPNDPLRGEWIAVAQRWLGADLLLSNSEYTARLLKESFPMCPPVAVVRPGVEPERSRPDAAAGAAARQELGLRAEEFTVGMFGRLQPWKGQHVLLEACRLLARAGEPVTLLFAGGSLFGLDLDYAEELRRRAEAPEFSGRVRFLGHRADTNALMNACDVVVHASVTPEPWGMVVIEAMAAGRPVIAAGAGGPLEMIEDGEDGILFPPGDAEALAERIRELRRDAALRMRLGARAREKAAREFTVAQTARQFCAAIEWLCPRREAGRGAEAAPAAEASHAGREEAAEIAVEQSAERAVKA